jgi:hypothetical protein
MSTPLLEKARQGYCPICGRGPFRVLSQHTVKAHEMDRFAIRDFLGLTFQDPLCDPSTSARLSEIARQRWPDGPPNKGVGLKGKRNFKKHLNHLREIGIKPGQVLYPQSHTVTHGTRSEYVWGCRCADCRAANRRYDAARRKASNPEPPAAIRHGTAYGYRWHRCRCSACTAANTREAAEYRKRRRDRTRCLDQQPYQTRHELS